MKKLALILSYLMSLVVVNLTATEVVQDDIVKVDNGVLYWKSGDKKGQEVALFGVNYSSPFAYTYRAIKQLGIDHKQAIDMDVDHIARFGLDAYRIHLWDRELADPAGNLLDNQHLALFDYLLYKLKKKISRLLLRQLLGGAMATQSLIKQRIVFLISIKKQK